MGGKGKAIFLDKQAGELDEWDSAERGEFVGIPIQWGVIVSGVNT